nr:transposase [Kitasatospora purpeofusca]
MGPRLRVLPPPARPRPGQGVPRPAPPPGSRTGRAGSRAERGQGRRRCRRRQPRLRRRQAHQRGRAGARAEGARAAPADRKRHVVVDTLGQLLAVMVTAADVGDRAAAQVLLGRVAATHRRLTLVRADGGHNGSLVENSLAVLAVMPAIVKRSDDTFEGAATAEQRWDQALKHGCREDGVGSRRSRLPTLHHAARPVDLCPGRTGGGDACRGSVRRLREWPGPPGPLVGAAAPRPVPAAVLPPVRVSHLADGRTGLRFSPRA